MAMRKGRQSRRQAPPVTFAGGATLTLANADRLLQDYVTPDAIEVDLSATEFIDPYGMVMLLCLAAEARAAQTRVTVRFPDHEKCCRYLSAMDLHKRLDEEGVKVVGAKNLRKTEKTPGHLLECHRFEREAFEDLVHGITGKLTDYGYHPNGVDELLVALYEIGGNVEEHANTFGGFLAAQTTKIGTADETIILAVGDVGVGIRASLNGGGISADTDRTALERAMQPGVSSVKEHVRGYGFEHMVDAVTKLRGSLFVRSDTAKATIERSGKDVLPKVKNVGRLGGTIVSARVPCANWRAIKEVDGHER